METRSSQPGPGALSGRTIIWGAIVVVTVTGGSMGLLLWQFWGAPPVTTLDVIRTAESLGIGTGGGVALLLAARRQRSIELDLIQKRESHRLQEKVAAETKAHQDRLAADNRHDSEERRITELQAKAGEQLGSEQAPVRLNGMYSLERLANNYPQLRQTIVNLICAYLRMPFEPPHGTGRKSMQSRRLGLRTRRLGSQLSQDLLLKICASRGSVKKCRFALRLSAFWLSTCVRRATILMRVAGSLVAGVKKSEST
ncbi:hypothetical protein [Saccharopolyspora shandongensis]|uniref:hypothetical protein n=1 Tax=Saccharopolyspora shandongensis TaxID=418495 RepID=UPI0033DCDEE2